MSKPIKRGTGLWEYLESSGVLAHGSDKDIENAKRAYKKEYYRTYRKKRKESHVEVSVTVPRKIYQRYKKKADKRHQSIGGYLLDAAIAYHKQKFLVPDPAYVAKLRQRLRLVSTDISMMTRHMKKLSQPELYQLYQSLGERISYLEEYIEDTLQNPIKL